MHYQNDPVHHVANQGWCFYTPDLQARFGPYPDQATAYKNVNDYIAYLNTLGPQPAPASDQGQLDQLVAEYLALRDDVEKMTKRHQAEAKVPKDKMEKAEGILMAFLNAQKLDSIGTKLGLVFTQVTTRCNVEDRTAFLEHIKQTGDFDLLQNRANSTNVKQWLDQNPGQQIPGVKVDYVREVRVRRK